MKKFTLSVVLSLFVLIAFGQIVKQGNSWNYIQDGPYPTCLKSSNCGWTGFRYSNYNYRIGADTLLGNVKYSTVYEVIQYAKNNISDDHIVGFIRDDENHKKIYFKSQTYGELEYLLYDFTLKKDSTFTLTKKYFINNQPSSFTWFREKVTSVDSIEVNGAKRLRLKFANQTNVWLFNEKIVGDTLEWIEGVGANMGLFNYDSSNPIKILCFSDGNQLIYQNTVGLSCDYFLEPVGIPSITTTKLTIFPNPAKDIVTIQNNQPMDNINLYSLDGAELLHFSNLDAKCQLNLRPLKRGVYIINVDGQFRKIIKE